jgi:hypothetical protein
MLKLGLFYLITVIGCPCSLNKELFFQILETNYLLRRLFHGDFKVVRLETLRHNTFVYVKFKPVANIECVILIMHCFCTNPQYLIGYNGLSCDILTGEFLTI